MKTSFLLFVVLICPYFIISQSTWVGGGGDNFWNTNANWSAGVPGPTTDAIIPNGSLVDLDLPGGNVKSLDIQGNAVFNMTTDFTFSDFYTIGSTATVNWANTLSGGGTLTNNGTINIGSSIATLGFGGTVTTLNNEGTINLTDIGDIFIFTGNVINNNAQGTIDFQSNFTGISRSNVAPHFLNNFGTMKITPPNTTDSVSINVEINNDNGTIQVENGTLNLNNTVSSNFFTDGFYNTFPGTTFNTGTFITTMAGTLAGTVEGTLNLPGTITVPIAATLNFGVTPSGIINFDPTINGGGTLTNSTKLTIDGFPVNIQDLNTTLLNQDLIEFIAAGDIFIGTNSTLNNDATGTIDFKGDTGNIQSSGASPNTFTNTGLIKTSFTGDGSDTAQISADLTNNGGTIEVNNGTLILFEENIILNGGIYNIAVDGILDWDLPVSISGSLTGTILGLMNWNSKVNIGGVASLDFTGIEIINWNNGNIDGGGVLTNNNILNITSGVNVFIYGGTTLNNNNIINFLSSGDILIATDGVLNNQILGTVNFLGDGSGIGINSSAPRTFNNFGDIFVILPDPSDNAIITSEFNNNNGNIQIERGTLNLSNSTANAQNLFDGVYNIFPEGAFDWDSDLTLSGELTGQVDGPINWRSDLWVNAATTATFFFTGIKTIFWSPGTLNGGGTLINQSNIDLTNNGSVNINGGTTLNNGGNFTLTTFGDLGVNTNGVINNLVDGVIEMQVPAGNILAVGGAPQTLNNMGTLRTDTGGINSVNIDTNNSGLIEIASGELEFATSRTLHNQLTGIIKGEGTLDIPAPANFTNDGTISPGSSPGILTVIGDYSSTSSATLEIEIDGLIQGTDFDYMPITNTTSTNVVFDGTVDVIMGFDADINDEFIISTVSGTGIISTCNLQSPVFASFGGMNYEFSVICRNDDEVVLTVTNETLGVDSNELLDNSIRIIPNPIADSFLFMNTHNVQLINAVVTDLRGSIILELNLENMGEQKTFNISELSSGLYFLRINSKLGSIVERIIKK